METEVESMVTVSIHQPSSSDPPLSTLVIDLTPPKPVSPTIQAPIFTATTTTTTTTLPLPPPPQQQSSSDPDLASRVSALEQMFESGTYQSQPEHVALYEALEVSMDRDNRDGFLEAIAKSCKRRRDDQDLPPSPPDLDQGKKKRHDSDASGSKQPPAPQSLVWKTYDTGEAPSSSSKQKFVPHSEQPVEEVPIPDDVNISDSEDIDTSHLPKIKIRLDWLKPVPEEDRPETPEPDLVIPLNDLPEPENN
ncbi:hypothetical protein Tco_0592749 [Tanacetum coccineum]